MSNYTHILQMRQSVDAVLVGPQDMEAGREHPSITGDTNMITMEKMDNCATELLSDQQTAYGPERIADLTKRILGSQSIIQYAQKSGVSKSWLSKALNAKLPGAPTRRIITRLWENSDDPTVRLSELLQVCVFSSTVSRFEGYQQGRHSRDDAELNG